MNDDPRPSPSRGAIRVAVTLPSAVDERIEEVRGETGMSKSDIIRRALLRDMHLTEHRRAGRRILIEDADGTIRQLEFVD